MELDLTQSEADALLAMEKFDVDHSKVWDTPDMGGSIIIPLHSADKREQFLLDISRGRIDLKKGSYQNRGRQVVILARLDFGGSPHRNPDGVVIPCPHLHLYKEGFGDKWAIKLPVGFLSKSGNTKDLLNTFMDYCNIKVKPQINWGLFA